MGSTRFTPVSSGPASPAPSERGTHAMHRFMTKAAALGLLVGVLACRNDTLLRPASLTPIDPLFDRYVSLGNSITAGGQTRGIQDSTQGLASRNLLARDRR